MNSNIPIEYRLEFMKDMWPDIWNVLINNTCPHDYGIDIPESYICYGLFERNGEHCKEA